MISIFNKELKTYLTSLFTYVYLMLFFCVTGVFTYSNCIKHSSTEFGFHVLTKSILVVMFFIPLCTMRLFAQEKKDKTDQMLFTAPISDLAILMGKTLATMLVVLVPPALSMVFPAIMSNYGTLSWHYCLSAYIAVFIISIIFVLIGIVVSVLSSNGILSAVITYTIYAIILVLRVIEGFVRSEQISRFINDYSYYNRLNDMISGVIRTKDLCYCVASCFLLFIAAWILLNIRRNGWKKNMVKGIALVLVFVGVVYVGSVTNEVYDMTAEQVLSLSSETKEKVGAIQSETTIYYLGKESHANVTYKELLNRYADLNDNIVIKYEELSDDSKIVQTYLSSFSSISEASLVVVSDSRYTFLDAKDYISETYTSVYSTKKLLNLENLLTSALCFVNSDAEETVLCLTGSGEQQLTSSFRNNIILNSYRLKDVDFALQASLLQSVFEDDYSLAFINGPQQDYTEAELKLLRKFLSRGGNLFVCIDPLNEDIPTFYDFLREYGLDIKSGLLYESDISRCALDTPYYIIPTLKESRFTDKIMRDKKQVLTMMSKGIVCQPVENGYKATDIMVTSKDSFSKLDDYENNSSKGEDDIEGPFAVAAVSEKEGEGSIFLLTSNVFFNEDVDMEANGANRKFFVNAFNQLTGAEEGVTVESKEVGTQTAFYPMAVTNAMKWICIVVLPLLCILAGIAVMIIRNKNLLIPKKDGGKKDEENTQEK